MTVERKWDVVWVTVFLVILSGLSLTLLPNHSILQLVPVPAWMGYWILMRGRRMGLWVALWGGILLETTWMVPPGCVVLFFLFFWWLVRTFRKDLPDQLSPLHGLLGGLLLTPLLRLWVWCYSLIWMGSEALQLAPDFAEMILAPALGALGGGVIFALAKRCEFRVLQPTIEEVRDDED